MLGNPIYLYLPPFSPWAPLPPPSPLPSSFISLTLSADALVHTCTCAPLPALFSGAIHGQKAERRRCMRASAHTHTRGCMLCKCTGATPPLPSAGGGGRGFLSLSLSLCVRVCVCVCVCAPPSGRRAIGEPYFFSFRPIN